MEEQCPKKYSRPKTTPFRPPPDFSRFFPRSRARGTGTERNFFVYRMGVFPPTHHPLTHFLRVFRISVVVSNRAFTLYPCPPVTRVRKEKANDFPAKKTKFHTTLPRFSEQEEHHLLLRLGHGGLVPVLLLLRLPSAVRHSHLFPLTLPKAKYEGHGNKANGTNVGSIQ